MSTRVRYTRDVDVAQVYSTWHTPSSHVENGDTACRESLQCLHVDTHQHLEVIFSPVGKHFRCDSMETPLGLRHALMVQTQSS